MDAAARRRSTPRRRRGFPPVIDSRVRILILGSFPSAASLRARQYYAHPRNQFWRILGGITGEPLADLEYPERLRRLLAHGIGLWDVIGACERSGSLDADIRDARPNRLAGLGRLAPHLAAVGFNGRTAARYEDLMRARGYLTAVLPSTSPAHAALGLEHKLELWQSFFARSRDALK